MISVEQTLEAKFPALQQFPASLIKKPAVDLLKKLLHEQEINQFLLDCRSKQGLDFVDHVLESFNFSYSVNPKQLEHIPTSGRVVIVANHPLGGLDGIALLSMLSQVRRDICIVASDVLSQIENLSNYMVPVDNFGQQLSRRSFRAVCDALEAEKAVIIFPSGEVSRIRPNGVRDTRWQAGFLKFARKTQSPILPIYIQARNSSLFYSWSILHKASAALLLAHETFQQKNGLIRFHVGNALPLEAVEGEGLELRQQIARVKRQLYRLKKKNAPQKKSWIHGETPLAASEPRQLLKKELKQAEFLGTTPDGKSIYLWTWQPDTSLMREIGRLREFSFRAVGEGVGVRRDIDQYDEHYRHLLLWDNEDLELVGAYRLGLGQEILNQKGLAGFYSHTLFNFKPEFLDHVKQGMELGRSFIQPRYWGSRSLDYLWYGIAAVLKKKPEIRYLFGPVSISNDYSETGKQLILSFYSHHFGAEQVRVKPVHPIKFSTQIASIESDADYKTAFKQLKSQLAELGEKVPTLFKQYTELCQAGGAQFHAFNLDPEFSDCIDGFIEVDLQALKPSRHKRYFGA